MELFTFSDGRRIHQTYAWVVPGKMPGLENFEVVIDPPSPETSSLAIADLKAWVLSEKPEPRFLKYKDQKGDIAHKKVSAAAALTGYVRAVLQRAGFRDSDDRTIHLLMPALASDEIHDRYRSVLTKAVRAELPEAEIETLSEPEMTLEFFRLVKNQVKIEPGANGVFLVVDSGASTTNFTIVMSTRSGQMTEATKRRRVHNLRAISYDAVLLAGHAIDRQILNLLEPEMKEVPSIDCQEMLAQVEQVKVEVARTRVNVPVSFSTGHKTSLGVDILQSVTKWLWKELQKSYDQIAAMLLEQLQKGAGQKLYGPMLVQHKVKAPSDISQLFDAVFLAGGTSLLPGFQEELRETLCLPKDTPIHSIGGAYPVAAAIGGLAYTLAPRPSARSSDNEPASAATEPEIDFTASLQVNVVLDCKDNKQGIASKPNRIEILNRRDPVARFGGPVEFPLPQSWSPRHTARARVIPSVSDDFRSERHIRKGSKFEDIRVQRPKGTGHGNFDVTAQRLTLRSADAHGMEKLYFVASRVPPLDDKQARSKLGVNALDIPKSLDVVIDIGMSKTVIAHAPRKTRILPEMFDHIEREMPKQPGYDRLALLAAPVVSVDTDNKEGSTLPHVGPVVGASALKQLENGLLVPKAGTIAVVNPPTTVNSPHTGAIASPDTTVIRKDNDIDPSNGQLTAIPPQPPAQATAIPSLPVAPRFEPLSTTTAFAPDGAFLSSPVLPDAQKRVVVDSTRPLSESSGSSVVQLNALASPLELSAPVERIHDTAAAGGLEGLNIDAKLLALAYLALCSRRFVMLAGPPGCGKSTIARMLAKMLGCTRENGFTDLSVQAHWVDDRPLFGDKGAVSSLVGSDNRFHLVLLDEVNLTRPEYYLARLFGALDHHGEIDGKRLPPLGVIGTLNIDDFSRPPSPKVLDRAMLLIVPPQRPLSQQSVQCAWRGASDDGPLKNLEAPVRRRAIQPGSPTPEAETRIRQWVDTAYAAFHAHRSMRADLVPSHRAIDDISRFAALHNTLGMSNIIAEAEALDQAILGRFVSTISGPEVEVRPLLEAWKPLCTDLPETGRRLERLLEQATNHGFASFWQ
jgi:MoxR-like ATPase